MLDLLRNFINGATTRFTANEWLYSDHMHLYVRKGHHYLDGKRCVTLDLASFEVYDKGRGTFTAFLHEAHAINPWEATYVECVHNTRLANWLVRHGFHREPDSVPGNFYLWRHDGLIKPEIVTS
jgi:hypothetical protein